MEVCFARSLFLYLTAIWFVTIQSVVFACPYKCDCDWGKRNINCSYQKLSSIPDFGMNASSIDTLNFSYNNLTIITVDTFAKLTNVISLQLDYNSIKEINGRAFSNLQKLQHLSLTGNVLTGLKSETFSNMTSLQKLTLSMNRLEFMEANAIANMPNLTFLDFTNNSFKELHQNSTGNLGSLTQLLLRNNQLTNIPTFYIAKIPTLAYLSLDNNNISTIGKYAFSGLSVLKDLYLSYNHIDRIDDLSFMNHYGDSMTNLSLTTLFLAGNRLQSIPHALQSMHTLLHLNLDNNKLETIGPSSLYTLRNLKILYLSRNDYLEEIRFKAFAGLTELKELFLSNNQKLKYIHPNAFIDSKNIEVVFMENNDLRNLSRELFYWDNIRMINIWSNKFVCSCDLLWIRKSSLLNKSTVRNYMEKTLCYTGNITNGILSFSAEKLACPEPEQHNNTKSRLMSGLVAASVVSGLLILCLVMMSCRRRFYNKYIQFKYRRQRDDPLFTVEDSRTKRSSNNKSRFLSTREETLM